MDRHLEFKDIVVGTTFRMYGDSKTVYTKMRHYMGGEGKLAMSDKYEWRTVVDEQQIKVVR